MPANLSPEYKSAQEAYRRAREPSDKLECLREMLRTIPKHKGTEHLQADIKTRIKALTEELSGPKKGAQRTGPALVVRREGAGQVALLGPPNSGKSCLHARLTGSHATVGAYPFATHVPLPGMLAYEDIQFQLLDLPSVSSEVMEPWLPNALQTADAALLVVDLGDPACLEHVDALITNLEAKKISLVAPEQETKPAATGDELIDPFHLRLPTLLMVNKADQIGPDPTAELDTFRQLSAVRFPALIVSAETGQGLDPLGPLLFRALQVVRVYTKVPGHAAAAERPFTLRGRSTVKDVALLIHRGRAEALKFARLWGSGSFDGQQVSGEHAVHDQDVVELHW